MLSVNGKISHNASHADTIWPRRSEPKIEEVFNWQIFRGREVLIKVIYGLGEERSRENNELEDNGENAFNWKIF